MNDRNADRIRDRTNGIVRHAESSTGILIIDMIGTFEYPDGDRLQPQALECAYRIDHLRTQARSANVPVIYVNDNYGLWRNDFQATLAAASRSPLGREIADILAPRTDDYHILKPQRSGFFATPLEVLLSALKVSELVITGVTTDICVFVTANDAYMRGYSVSVPADCSAAVDEKDHIAALSTLKRIAQANILPSRELELEARAR